MTYFNGLKNELANLKAKDEMAYYDFLAVQRDQDVKRKNWYWDAASMRACEVGSYYICSALKDFALTNNINLSDDFCAL